MTTTPRLTIGVPVYNGEQYLGESLDALLGQTYEDFELIISDNASTDRTERVCRRYLDHDSRIRYIRQPYNMGSAENYNFVFRQARGELFKWADHDDLCSANLLLKCVEALDADPSAVLSQSSYAIFEDGANVGRRVEYQLSTDAERPSHRFRSFLFGEGGEDGCGVIRANVLRATPLHGSYYMAGRPLVAELTLHGRFCQVPEVLFFRRHCPGQQSAQTKRGLCATFDPRRASRLRHPTARLLTEYAWAFIACVRRAPISTSEKRVCYRYLSQYLASRMKLSAFRQQAASPPTVLGEEIDLEAALRGTPAVE
jgi:glycosyltransferase involved in cell wall biosynthesis